MYIGGKQVRPDSGYSRLVYGSNGRLVGEVGEGNRKDVRNAVEAAHKALTGWSESSGHLRGQILYYVAENLSARDAEFAESIQELTGKSAEAAWLEVQAAVERFFTYAAWADKYDGYVHSTPFRVVTQAMPEPIGVLGIACPDEFPLLGFVSLVAPAVAMANTVVAVPSEAHPLSATDLYQVFDTSDVPAGVINIVTGSRNGLSAILAAHDDVQGVWYFGDHDGATQVELSSAGNMKRTWTHWDGERDWLDRREGEGEEFLRESTQVKNIWTPYGA
jgi:aldehyde dehydrogenase (NAD+)